MVVLCHHLMKEVLKAVFIITRVRQCFIRVRIKLYEYGSAGVHDSFLTKPWWPWRMVPFLHHFSTILNKWRVNNFFHNMLDRTVNLEFSRAAIFLVVLDVKVLSARFRRHDGFWAPFFDVAVLSKVCTDGSWQWIGLKAPFKNRRILGIYIHVYNVIIGVSLKI